MGAFLCLKLLLVAAAAIVAAAVALAVKMLAALGANEVGGIILLGKSEKRTASGALDLVLIVAIVVAVAAIALIAVKLFLNGAEILIKLLAVVADVLNVLSHIGNVVCDIFNDSDYFLKKLRLGLCLIKSKTVCKTLKISSSFGKCHIKKLSPHLISRRARNPAGSLGKT